MDWRDVLLFRLMRLARRLHLDRILVGSPRPFNEYLKGFERVGAVKNIFGTRTEEVLRNLKIEFTFAGYMGVNPSNGHLLINSRYLDLGNRTDIYLDVIHELVHVRQYLEGRELFDSRYGYSERPTEVEAYKYAVEEARRLGLNEERICQYLKTEWMSDRDMKKLAKAVGAICR